MSDSNRPPLPPALEAVAACVEPLYATVMRIRNALYDKGYFATHSLGRPAVSVGNITAGGTGKTPVSIWLATKLAKSNHHPAVLLRGYKTTAEGISDEAEVLRNSLAGIAPVIVNRSRVRGAAAALRDHPDTTVFVLDDAMQHRGAKRNFDLVLINARNPFGFDRILPRGLLREPLQELRRASAFLITHASEVPPANLSQIGLKLWRHNSTAPIYRADHQLGAFLNAEGQEINPSGKSYFAFCGLGSPDSFFATLAERLGKPTGTEAFPDHHAYTRTDLAQLPTAGAEYLITTEKDWAKISRLKPAAPILRAQLTIHFPPGQEDPLFEAILKSFSTAT